jgi:hypothetical protein
MSKEINEVYDWIQYYTIKSMDIRKVIIDGIEYNNNGNDAPVGFKKVLEFLGSLNDSSVEDIIESVSVRIDGILECGMSKPSEEQKEALMVCKDKLLGKIKDGDIKAIKGLLYVITEEKLYRIFILKKNEHPFYVHCDNDFVRW